MAQKTIKTFAQGTSNADILNAIRVDASLAYQQRVPAATQGDISESINNLTMYKPMMNEFVDALVNRIGDVIIKSRIWENPLQEFKRGMMQYGETIEELYVNIIQAKRYNPNECYEDVWKCSPPEVLSNFHTINRQDHYDLTVNDMLLRRAFLTDYGLQDLVGRILEQPYNSDYYDEYLIMKQLFVEYAKKDSWYKVQVPDAGAVSANRSQVAKDITEALRAWSSKLTFMNSSFNAAGVTTFTPKSDLVLFVTPEMEAMLDVNVIAFAFNASAAEMQTRVIVVDDFGIDGCQAILADREFFVCADTNISFESIRNPKQLSWNYFLHHWGVYSCSRFVNAVMFTTQPGSSVTVPTVTQTGVTVDYEAVNGVKPTFASVGGRNGFKATVAGAVTPPTPGYIVPQGVTWSVARFATEPGTLSSQTFIDPEGCLHVAPNETVKKVTVTAAALYGNVKGTLDVSIGAAATNPVVEPVNPV